jgi:tetratricopeptide (TPR) repeat protein
MYRRMLAVLALTACGGHQKKMEVSTGEPVTVPTPTTVATPATVVPENVSYADAESAYTSRHYSDAVTMFDAYTKHKPENAWGYYMLGLSAWKTGQLDRAADAFETAVAKDPKHVKALVNLSRVRLEQEKPSEALESIQSALALDSTSGSNWRVLGRVDARLGKVDDAIDAYRRAIQIDSNDTWAMNDMGLVLIDNGRYCDALGPLARAVQLDTTVAAFQNNLGLALERTGHVAAAKSAFENALKVDSSYAKAKVSLTRVSGQTEAKNLEPLDLDAIGHEFAAETAGEP